MKRFPLMGLMVLVAIFLINCASGLPSVKSSIELKRVMDKPIMAPYSIVTNYYGYIKPGQAPDEVVNGKKVYYLYVWVPAVIAEMGVRMISPTGEIGDPSKEDLQSDAFKVATPSEKSMPNWFDTWIRVERMAAIMPDQIAKAAKGKVLQVLGNNDDGDNTYEETRHSRYNSLLRISIPNPPKSFNDLKNLDTKKLLVRGLYRIAFTTYKVGEVKGSFVATVGLMFPPGIPGLSPQIHSNPVELQKLVTAPPADKK